jgi:hypothetical protein
VHWFVEKREDIQSEEGEGGDGGGGRVEIEVLKKREQHPLERLAERGIASARFPETAHSLLGERLGFAFRAWKLKST